MSPSSTSFLDKLIHPVKQFFRWITNQDVEPNHSEEYNKRFDELNDLGVTEEEIYLDKPYLMQKISDYGSKFRALGEEDGLIGQSPGSVKHMAENKANQWRAFLEAAFQSQQVSAAKRREELEKIHGRAKENFEYQQEYVKSIEDSYRWNYKRFNRSMGFFYLIISIIFVAADLPLSLKLIEHGFKIEATSFNDNTFLKYLNEGGLLALGITLITVYVKIYYDEFLGEPIEKSITQFYQKNLPGIEQRDLPGARRVWNYRLMVKTLILIAVLGMFIFLGIFREISLADKDQVGAWMPKSETTVDWIRLTSFIMLSLIFPAAGGICASLGLDRLHNASELRASRERLEKLARVESQEFANYTIANNEVANYNSYLRWCEAEGNFVKDYTQFFISCYQHGYGKGWTIGIPDDAFDAALALSAHQVARTSLNQFIHN